MIIMANEAVTWTAQTAAVTTTRNKSKQRGWLVAKSQHMCNLNGAVPVIQRNECSYSIAVFPAVSGAGAFSP